MKLVLELDETDLRDAIAAINDDKRQSGDVNKLTLRQFRAKLKDPDYLQLLAADTLTRVLEDLA